MQDFTLRQRARYWFDNTMAKGTRALVGWLAAVSLLLAAAVSTALGLLDPVGENGVRRSFEVDLWASFVRVFRLSGVPERGRLPVIMLMMALALGGIFITSALIGLLTTALDRRLEELRKGRSPVVESNHVVVLGWSDQVFTIVAELAQAGRSRRRSVIAVLAEMDKIQMEDTLRARIGSTGNTRVVCRTGNPIDPADLEIVSPHTARSVILAGPADEGGDAHVIKTLLAVTHAPGHRPGSCSITASVCDSRNLAVARLAGGTEAVVIDTDDVTARLIAQTSYQPGLSGVYLDLLDFAGQEIYLHSEDFLAGVDFGTILDAYPTASPIGIVRAGQVQLAPPMDTRFESGDQLILLAEDDSTIAPVEHEYHVDEHAIVPPVRAAARPTRILIIGWNRRAVAVIGQLDKYADPQSQINVVTERDDVSLVVEALTLTHTKITVNERNPADPRVLRDLGVDSYDQVIVLCDDRAPALEADARVLAILLHLRSLSPSGERCSVVSEMRDERDRSLAHSAQVDDFIVSDKMITLLMAQISEEPRLAHVFADLFDADGVEIYLRAAGDYVRLGTEITYATVLASARLRGEVAIGYRYGRGGVATLNPAKNVRITPAAEDRVIVLAEGH